MHVAAAIFAGLVALIAVLMVVGATPFLVIPLVVILVAAPLAWMLLAKVLAGRVEPSSDVPTSGQSAYDPVVRPND